MQETSKDLESSSSSFSKPLQIEKDITKAASERRSSRVWSVPKRDMISTCVSFFGATFGIGSLGLAASMASIGIVGWFFTFILAVLVNYATVHSLAYLGHNFNLVNFVDLSPLVGGRPVKTLVLVLFFITNIGGLLSAAVIFNDLVCNIVKDIGVRSPLLTQNMSLVWLVLPAVLLFPVLIKRQLKDLAVLTLVSIVSAAYIVFFLVWNLLFAAPNKNPDNQIAHYTYFNWSSLPGIFGYLSFTLMSQGNVLNIYQELSEKSVANMKKITIIHLSIFSFIYISMSLIGYLIFYNHPEIKNLTILELFKNDRSHLLLLANILMTIAALNSFIFSFKPVKDTIIQLLKPSGSGTEGNENSDFDPLNMSVTLSLVCFTIMIAGFLTLNEIGFLKIIDLLCNVVLPVLFIMFPLYVFLRKEKSRVVSLAFGLSSAFYIWKMSEYTVEIVKALF